MKKRAVKHCDLPEVEYKDDYFFAEDDKIQPREGKIGDPQLSTLSIFLADRIDSCNLLIDFGSGNGVLPEHLLDQWPNKTFPEYWAVDLREIIDSLRLDRRIGNNSKKLSSEEFFEKLSERSSELKSKKVVVVIRNVLHHLTIEQAGNLFYHLITFLPKNAEVFIQDICYFPIPERLTIEWPKEYLGNCLTGLGFRADKNTNHDSKSGHDWYSIILTRESPNTLKKDCFIKAFADVRKQQLQDIQQKFKDFHYNFLGRASPEDQRLHDPKLRNQYLWLTHKLSILSTQISDYQENIITCDHGITTSSSPVTKPHTKKLPIKLPLLSLVTDWLNLNNMTECRVGKEYLTLTPYARGILINAIDPLFRHYHTQVRVRKIRRLLDFEDNDKGNCTVTCIESLYARSDGQLTYAPCSLVIDTDEGSPSTSLESINFHAYQNNEELDIIKIIDPQKSQDKDRIVHVAMLRTPVANEEEGKLEWTYNMPGLFRKAFCSNNPSFSDMIWFEGFRASEREELIDEIDIQFKFPSRINSLLSYCSVELPNASKPAHTSSQQDERLDCQDNWRYVNRSGIRFGPKQTLRFRFFPKP